MTEPAKQEPTQQLSPQEERAAEVKRLDDQLYEKRKTCDPRTYDRIIAYHPQAATSDAGFAAFVADYDAQAALAEPARSA
jgi:hypothetical protein